MAYPQIRPGIEMTPYLNLVLTEISSYIPNSTMVISAFRSREKQVDIIESYARKEKYTKFSKKNIDFADKKEWRPALKYLRGKGYKIATPGHSRHETGIALDLIHLPNSSRKYLVEIKKAFSKAESEGKIKILSDIIEWGKLQKCYHVEVKTVRLEFAPKIITPGR